MAWSYRQDGLDEIYHDKPGPALVSGETLPATPAGPPSDPMGRSADKKAEPEKEPKKKEKVT